MGFLLPPSLFPSSRERVLCIKSGIAPGTLCTFLVDVRTLVVSFVPTSKSILFQPANEKVEVRLEKDVTSPATPGVNIDPAANIHWFADGCTGIQQHAYQPIPAYTPLFCLRSIRRPL